MAVVQEGTVIPEVPALSRLWDSVRPTRSHTHMRARAHRHTHTVSFASPQRPARSHNPHSTVRETEAGATSDTVAKEGLSEEGSASHRPVGVRLGAFPVGGNSRCGFAIELPETRLGHSEWPSMS